MRSFLGLLITTGGATANAVNPTLPQGIPAIPPTYLPPSYQIGENVIGFKPAVSTATDNAPLQPTAASADVSTDVSHPASNASHAPANRTAEYVPPSLPKSVDQVQMPDTNELVKNARGGYRVVPPKYQPQPGIHHVVNHQPNAEKKPAPPLTVGEKFEASAGILKDKTSVGYSANRVGDIVNHMEDEEMGPFDLSKTITRAFHHPKSLFGAMILIPEVILILVLGYCVGRKLLQMDPNLIEDSFPGANDIESHLPALPQAYYTGLEMESRFWARWQHVEEMWERSSDFLTFIRFLRHGQARDMTSGLMRSADGEIEMAPQDASYQAPPQVQEKKQAPKQEKPKQASEWQSSVQAFADVTDQDEYQQMLTPR